MTLEALIKLLNTSGINSKELVKKALETENISELMELRWSITEKINKILGETTEEQE